MLFAASYDALVPSPVFQALKAFHLAAMAFSTCSFHHQVSRGQRWGRIVPHTSSVILSRPVLMLFQLSSVAASATPALTCKLKTSWKWLLVWGSLTFQTLRWGVNLRLDFGGTSWSLSAWLCFQTCTWWDGCHVSWNVFPRSKLNARAYSRVLSPSTSGSGLPYPMPPCTFLYPEPAWPTFSLQSPHGIINSDPGILAVIARSWSKNRSLTSSLRPLCGAYTDRKVTTG